MDRSFFTYASGKKYLDFAFTLARSYKLHNTDTIPFYIVSDTAIKLPQDLRWVNTKVIPLTETGTGLEFKLNFHNIPETNRAIFIDADSIIYGDISSLFDDLDNDAVTVLGIKIKEGNWVNLESREVLMQYNIPYIIRYCGAFYYVVKNELCEKVYEFAQNLLKEKERYHQHSFGVNEEPIMSISMSKFGIEPFPDSGNIWSDLVQFTSNTPLNVFMGPPHFQNLPINKDYKFWLPEGGYNPTIIHMGGGTYNKNPWIFDSLRLKFHYQLGLSKALSNWLVTCIMQPAYFILKKAKKAIEEAS